MYVCIHADAQIQCRAGDIHKILGKKIISIFACLYSHGCFSSSKTCLHIFKGM